MPERVAPSPFTVEWEGESAISVRLSNRWREEATVDDLASAIRFEISRKLSERPVTVPERRRTRVLTGAQIAALSEEIQQIAYELAQGTTGGAPPAEEVPGQIICGGITVRTLDDLPVNVEIDETWVRRASVAHLADSVREVLERAVVGTPPVTHHIANERLARLTHDLTGGK